MIVGLGRWTGWQGGPGRVGPVLLLLLMLLVARLGRVRLLPVRGTSLVSSLLLVRILILAMVAVLLLLRGVRVQGRLGGSRTPRSSSFLARTRDRQSWTGTHRTDVSR